MSHHSERKFSKEIFNPFRWSKSRASTFTECKRKYYLRYYQHWGGWKEESPEINRLAYRLGKMVSMATLVGSAVHEVLARHFRGLQNDRFRELVPEQAVEIMRRVWMDARKELWRRNPKKFPPLFEIYYDRVPPVERLQAYADQARRAVAAVGETPLYKLARSLDRSDFLWVDPVRDTFSEEIFFSVPPFEAIFVPDLVLRAEGRILIVDWKTGKARDQDHLQMEAGAIWARQRLDTAGAEIQGVLAYLSPGLVDEFTITDQDCLRARRVIVSEMEAMSGYLKDPLKNIPLVKEAFPMHNNVKFCKYCEFQEICLTNSPSMLVSGSNLFN
ncbi:MAG: PD-(D/E)XK nuclease family protein [Candidatus Euphemobacter frigidus]|nr:PD-(D/E)XK nuclease family protein [Candidatus Euphemobacter frigidus]MDP8276503.1 PD-(D/E)XK nuclease family protein [Candidatus Euphemobacter frigidus]